MKENKVFKKSIKRIESLNKKLSDEISTIKREYKNQSNLKKYEDDTHLYPIEHLIFEAIINFVSTEEDEDGAICIKLSGNEFVSVQHLAMAIIEKLEDKNILFMVDKS